MVLKKFLIGLVPKLLTLNCQWLGEKNKKTKQGKP